MIIAFWSIFSVCCNSKKRKCEAVRRYFFTDWFRRR